MANNNKNAFRFRYDIYEYFFVRSNRVAAYENVRERFRVNFFTTELLTGNLKTLKLVFLETNQFGFRVLY